MCLSPLNSLTRFQKCNFGWYGPPIGDIDIGGNSVYDDGPLSLVGQLFIGGTVTSESNPNASDDVYVGAPEFCSDDLFFSDELRD